MDDQNIKPDQSWYENGDRIIHDFYAPMDMKWFLDMMYENAPRGYLGIYTGDKQYELFDTDRNIYAVHSVMEWMKKTGVFFSIGIFDYDLRDSGSRDPKDVIVVPCTWINIKIRCLLNQDPQLPTQREAYNFLKRRAYQPTFIVDTGSELQAYWHFDKPAIIETDCDRDKTIKMVHEFQQKIIADAQRHGWHIEETSSIANLQRLPGTWNHDFTPPKPITLMEYAHI